MENENMLARCLVLIRHAYKLKLFDDNYVLNREAGEILLAYRTKLEEAMGRRLTMDDGEIFSKDLHQDRVNNFGVDI